MPEAESPRSAFRRQMATVGTLPISEEMIQSAGTQLRGRIIHGGDDHAPLLVMVPGNAMTAADLEHEAEWHAKSFGCNVLVYDGRGQGRSDGKEKSLGDAVTDCRAAIEYARARSGQVGVWGFSLGGGIAAEALASLKAEGKSVALFVNNQSFGSLARAAGSLVDRGLKSSARTLAAKIFSRRKERAAVHVDMPEKPTAVSRVVSTVSGAVFRAAGFTNLNTAKLIARAPLAKHTLIFSTRDDGIIVPHAQLKTQLLKKRPDLAHGADGIIFSDGQGAHGSGSYMADPAYLQTLRSWAAPPAPLHRGVRADGQVAGAGDPILGIQVDHTFPDGKVSTLQVSRLPASVRRDLRAGTLSLDDVARALSRHALQDIPSTLDRARVSMARGVEIQHVDGTVLTAPEHTGLTSFGGLMPARIARLQKQASALLRQRTPESLLWSLVAHEATQSWPPELEGVIDHAIANERVATAKAAKISLAVASLYEPGVASSEASLRLLETVKLAERPSLEPELSYFGAAAQLHRLQSTLNDNPTPDHSGMERAAADLLDKVEGMGELDSRFVEEGAKDTLVAALRAFRARNHAQASDQK